MEWLKFAKHTIFSRQKGKKCKHEDSCQIQNVLAPIVAFSLGGGDLKWIICVVSSNNKLPKNPPILTNPFSSSSNILEKILKA
jgi:hypothetical protein